MGAKPDQIRSDIERTRADLARDVEQLVDRTVRHGLRERAGGMGDLLRAARSKVMGARESAAGQTRTMARKARGTAGGTAGQAAESARGGTGQAMGTMRSAPRQVARQAGGSPLAAGVIALGAGMLAAWLIPSSKAERSTVGRIGERAGGVAEPIRQSVAESARRVGEEATTAGRQAAEQVSGTATEAARDTREHAREQAGQVKEQAGESAEAVKKESRRPH